MPISYTYKFKPKRGAERWVTKQRHGGQYRSSNCYSSYRRGGIGDALIGIAARAIVKSIIKE